MPLWQCVVPGRRPLKTRDRGVSRRPGFFVVGTVVAHYGHLYIQSTTVTGVLATRSEDGGKSLRIQETGVPTLLSKQSAPLGYSLQSHLSAYTYCRTSCRLVFLAWLLQYLTISIGNAWADTPTKVHSQTAHLVVPKHSTNDPMRLARLVCMHPKNSPFSFVLSSITCSAWR